MLPKRQQILGSNTPFDLARIVTLLIVATIGSTSISHGQQPIDREEILRIGGISQVIWVKGNDSNKPLLLFLHGGPGNSVMSYANKFCNKLYEHFVVIHWDQRDVGETLKLNASPADLTFQLFKSDAEQLIDSLLIRFHRDKLFVVGHSWGTALGFHLVGVRPDALHAFVAIGSMVHQAESERLALNAMLESAAKRNDVKATQDLKTITIPFQNGEQLYLHRSHTLKLMESKKVLDRAHVSKWSAKWLSLFNEASEVNLFQTLPSVECPVYFIAGRKDFQTNSELAERYFNTVEAPAKNFYWIDNAGHNIPSSNGVRMQEIIIDIAKKVNQKSND